MSGRLTLPENTLLFGGRGKYSSVRKVTVTLCPATLRTAQILGGSKVYARPSAPPPRGHRAGPSQGRGPQPKGRTFNPRTGAKRGPTALAVPTSKAAEFLQPRRRLFWHLGLAPSGGMCLLGLLPGDLVRPVGPCPPGTQGVRACVPGVHTPPGPRRAGLPSSSLLFPEEGRSPPATRPSSPRPLTPGETLQPSG